MRKPLLHKRAADYFPGHNFITPHRIKCGRKKGIAWELSEGTGIDQNPLYGVSLRDAYTGDIMEGKAFKSLEAARSFIRWLGHEED